MDSVLTAMLGAWSHRGGSCRDVRNQQLLQLDFPQLDQSAHRPIGRWLTHSYRPPRLPARCAFYHPLLCEGEKSLGRDYFRSGREEKVSGGDLFNKKVSDSKCSSWAASCYLFGALFYALSMPERLCPGPGPGPGPGARRYAYITVLYGGKVYFLSHRSGVMNVEC
jgi:hypothetical protein